MGVLKHTFILWRALQPSIKQLALQQPWEMSNAPLYWSRLVLPKLLE